jgi:tetratricopeptide (TPR) repeat protein
MNQIRDFLQRLREVPADTRAQAAVAAEFLVMTRPESQHEPLFAALDAAAVLRWYDTALLGKVLEISIADARRRLKALDDFTFVEHYRRGRGERETRNLHEATRLGWRQEMFRSRVGCFRALSAVAASCFAHDASPAGRVEWIYHVLCSDPDLGASELAKLDRQWSVSGRPENRYTLATALQELEETHLVSGRARAWTLLVIAWIRETREETAQLAEIVSEALDLARNSEDDLAMAEATCLSGDIWQAQGDLGKAQKAFEDYLAITRELAERDPKNSDWQRDLGVAHNRVGNVLLALGNLEAAQAAFAEDLAISRGLAEGNPSNTGWQRNLAAALVKAGDVLQLGNQLSEAKAVFDEYLAINRRLVTKDASNASLQRSLAVAHNRVGNVLLALDKPGAAQKAFRNDLLISRRLAEQDASNSGWQRDLAVALQKMGEVLQVQGKLPAAQTAFREYLSISRRLAGQDPGNAHRQSDLAMAHNRMGGVLQAQGKIEAAQAAFDEALAILRGLTQRDPSNTDWVGELATVCFHVAQIEAGVGRKNVALLLYKESLHSLTALVERAPGVARWRDDLKKVEAGLSALRESIAC